jgi:hypothetical protein
VSEIREAVEKLDFENDSHWTSDDLPAMKAVENILGYDVSRQEVEDATNGYRRPYDDEED